MSLYIRTLFWVCGERAKQEKMQETKEIQVNLYTEQDRKRNKQALAAKKSSNGSPSNSICISMVCDKKRRQGEKREGRSRST